MIKLIATDMDGTLLDENKKLPKDFFDILNQLSEKGVRFVAASGRSYVTLYQNFSPFSDKLDYICDNGAFVIADGGITDCSVIGKNDVKAVVEECEAMKLDSIHLVLCGKNGTYLRPAVEEFNKEIMPYYINRVIVDDLTAVDDDIFKIAICDLNGPENYSYNRLKEKLGEKLSMQISGAVWMDAMNKGVNKGNALYSIQKKFGISYDETMAFGDFYNDIELLKQGKYSFVMANANEDMFQYGNYKAKSNAENGVIEAIKKYVL